MPTGDDDDFEDFDDDSGLEDDVDTEQDPIEKKFAKSQLELVTQTLDHSIKSLADMVASQQIDTNPKYQRRLRWDDKRQSKLVESFLMNVPIPPIFLAETAWGKFAVIDGQQRLRALDALFTNMLKLAGLEFFEELNGKRFKELSSEVKNILVMRPSLRCIIILRQSDPQIQFEVFERLNTGGVRLNAQEIRNSAFSGPLNDLVIELSENSLFRSALDVKQPAKSKIVQHMRDCELILRFFALKDSWNSFSGSMKGTLNNFMKDNEKADSNKLKELKRDFLDTLERVHSVFGADSFRRWLPHKNTWNRQVMAAMFDAQMFSFYRLKPSANQVSELKKECKKLFIENPKFVQSVDSGTNAKASLKHRVEVLIHLVSPA